MQETSIPVAMPVSMPGASDRPRYDGAAKDVWATALFWVHFIAIVGVALALAPGAVKADYASTEDDADRPVLDINAWTFLKVVIVCCVISAVASLAA